MKKHHMSLKAKYKYIVIAYDGNHSLKFLYFSVKLVDLNTTISFWLRMKKWDVCIMKVLVSIWYEFSGENIVLGTSIPGMTVDLLCSCRTIKTEQPGSTAFPPLCIEH